MKTSRSGLEFIKKEEGLRLKAYKDSGGVWTIGYGHTSDANLKVTKGLTITKEKANELLKLDVEEAEAGIDMDLRAPLQGGNMYGSLVSLVFNIGVGAFQKSTLLKKLNKQDYQGAANEFSKWIYDNGEKNDGLVARRAREKALFLTPDKEKAVPKVSRASVTAKKKKLPKGTTETAGGLLAATGFAEYMGWFNQVKDYVGDYGPYILGGILGITLLGLGIRYFRKVD